MNSYNRNAICETQNITKSYQGQNIIENVSITLYKGEIVGVLGMSGVGKTTLFNIIAELVPSDSGEVLHTGKISYMLQKDLLLPYKTVLDNVCLPLIIRKEGVKQARARVASLLPAFGLQGCANNFPDQLSGGMRQRAAFLRTYLCGGEVLLLDEPFSALDSITRVLMQMWYIDMARKMGMSSFFITHDVDEAIFLSDRIYILGGTPGKITGEVILADKPKDVTRDFMLTETFLEYKREVNSFLYKG